MHLAGRPASGRDSFAEREQTAGQPMAIGAVKSFAECWPQSSSREWLLTVALK
jgi:hypothetical protein